MNFISKIPPCNNIQIQDFIARLKIIKYSKWESKKTDSQTDR